MNRGTGLIVLGLVAGLPLAVFATDTPSVKDKEFVYNDHGRRDPFSKLVSPTGVVLTHENDLTAADLILEGILADSMGKSVAIINSRVLKEGDRLGAFRVMQITSDAVTLQRGDQEMINLKLKKEE